MPRQNYQHRHRHHQSPRPQKMSLFRQGQKRQRLRKGHYPQRIMGSRLFTCLRAMQGSTIALEKSLRVMAMGERRRAFLLLTRQ